MNAPRLMAALTLFSAASVAISGPVDPPAGPVQPTMKTLDEVEPRTAINQDNTPGDANSAFRIDEPGSYYLTQNYVILSLFGSISGIEIATSNVTIDLNGFSLLGGTGAAFGVSIDGNRQNITISNGALNGFDSHALNFGSDATEIALADLRLTDNGGDGVYTLTSARVTAERVAASNNGGSGMIVGTSSIVRDCRAINNGGNGIKTAAGSTVANSTAEDNALAGFDLFWSTTKGCTAEGNTGNGFTVAGGVITDCTSRLNTGNGFQLLGQSTARHCSAQGNTLSGYDLALTTKLFDSSADDNDDAGVKASGRCTIQRNTIHGDFDGSPGYGIWVTGDSNLVTDNHVYGGNTGYEFQSFPNFIARNTAVNSSWNVVTGNHCLVIDALAITIGPVTGQSGGREYGSTDPNANFSF